MGVKAQYVHGTRWQQNPSGRESTSGALLRISSDRNDTSDGIKLRSVPSYRSRAQSLPLISRG